MRGHPLLAAVAAAVVTLIVTAVILPRVPGSPVACLAIRHGDPCASHMNWVFGLCVLAPAGTATLCRDWCERRRGRR